MEPQQVYQSGEETFLPSAAATKYYGDQYGIGSASGDLGRELTRQLTRALNLPRDTEALRAEESTRGAEHNPIVHLFITRLLRNGLLYQAGALFFMNLFYLGFGGRGFFVFDSLVGPEAVRVSDAYHLLVALLLVIYLGGCLQIAGFQIFIADSSKWTVGFRSGSKFLSAAVFMDILATTLRLVQSVHAYFYLSVQWWAKFQRTQSDWGLYHIAATLHAFALLSYGVAFFFLESYHDEGTSEEYAVALLVLFGCAGAAELFMVYTNYGAFFSLLLLLALGVGVNWAFQFEPLLERCSPELHSRNVADNILPHAEMLRSKAGLMEAETASGGETVSGTSPSAMMYSAGSPGGAAGLAGTPTYTAVPVPLEGEEGGPPEGGEADATTGLPPRSSASVIGMYRVHNESPETAPPTTSIPLSVLQMPGQTHMPTTYDYSQIHQQMQNGGVEPGVVRGPPPP